MKLTFGIRSGWRNREYTSKPGNRSGPKGLVKGYGRTLNENFYPADEGEFHATSCHPPGR